MLSIPCCNKHFVSQKKVNKKVAKTCLGTNSEQIPDGMA